MLYVSTYFSLFAQTYDLSSCTNRGIFLHGFLLAQFPHEVFQSTLGISGLLSAPHYDIYQTFSDISPFSVAWKATQISPSFTSSLGESILSVD